MSPDNANRIVQILKDSGVDFFTMLPCEKVRKLYDLISERFKHITLSREEEGVGICAGAYLAGARPAMLVQSSGIGNMINALSSLTETYQLPLLILVSWRGVYNEKIPAQIPLGRNLPKILRSMGVHCVAIKHSKDLSLVDDIVGKTYRRHFAGAILLSPSIWEEEQEEPKVTSPKMDAKGRPSYGPITALASGDLKPVMTRFEILRTISSYLDGKIVVCNLGAPCRELFAVKHQKSNFYMLGSMGLASSIGLGISTFTSKKVVVIEGDGSLLTNLGALSTISVSRPKNLTILAVDNGVHGSTGNQPTATSICVDLEATAKGLGFRKTYKAASTEDILSAIHSLDEGPSFVHIIAKPGNAEVPEVPISPTQIKRETMEALAE